MIGGVPAGGKGPAGPPRVRTSVPALALLGLLVGATLVALRQEGEAAALSPLAVAVVAFAVMAAAEARRPRLGRPAALAASGLLIAAAVGAPPRHSADVWSYAMYGRIAAVHRASPYAHAPAEFAGDPFYPLVSPRWVRAPSVYGPLFTALSAAGMAGARSPLAARLWFQGLAAAAVGGALVLLARQGAGGGALAWLGLNPLVVVSVVNGGHNDALAGLGVLAGVVLAGRGRDLGAGACLGLAGLVKLTALLPGAGVTAWVWRRRGPLAGVAAGGAAAAVTAVGYLLAGGPAVLRPLRAAGRIMSTGGVWNEYRRRLADALVAAGVPPGPADAAAREQAAAWAAVAVVLLAGLLVAARLRDRSPGPAAGAAGLAYLLAGSSVAPWHAAWTLPALAADHGSAEAWATATQGWALLFSALWLRAIGGASRWMPGVVAALPVLAMALAAFAVGAAVLRIDRRRREAGGARGR